MISPTCSKFFFLFFLFKQQPLSLNHFHQHTKKKEENLIKIMKTISRIIEWIGVKFWKLNAYSWVIEMKEEGEEGGEEKKTNVDISLSFRLSWLLVTVFRNVHREIISRPESRTTRNSIVSHTFEIISGREIISRWTLQNTLTRNCLPLHWFDFLFVVHTLKIWGLRII